MSLKLVMWNPGNGIPCSRPIFCGKWDSQNHKKWYRKISELFSMVPRILGTIFHVSVILIFTIFIFSFYFNHEYIKKKRIKIPIFSIKKYKYDWNNFNINILICKSVVSFNHLNLYCTPRLYYILLFYVYT